MNFNRDVSYDHAFEVDNVYGHALQLLKNLIISTELNSNAIHLDLGCGFGRIAEPLVAVTGLTYVGIDGDDRGISALRQRGFEAHVRTFSFSDALVADLREIIGGRSVASITMLDTLEHLVEGDEVLDAISTIAQQHNAPVVISVPNNTHRDIGLKLILGRWDYTDQGLLDHTHVRLFDEKLIRRVLLRVGLHPVSDQHVHRLISDQHFPMDHPAFGHGSVLSAFLKGLRQQADSNDDVMQFVFACLSGPRLIAPPYSARNEARRPFLSIVTRTQGKRLQSLLELFVCLAGQTSLDFEVRVIGHKMTVEQQLAVERLIEDNPEWLRSKIYLHRVERGNRTHPINVGFEKAEGQYIVILDDDDIPMAHWVETFKILSSQAPGRLLRSACVRQDTAYASVNGRKGLRATGQLSRIYPNYFDLFDHLKENKTPPMSIAFPRGLFHDLHMKFDEKLDTTEDWDYILRCAVLVGVENATAITSIYRWWTSDESSRTLHAEKIWHENYHYIQRKINSLPLLLEPGSAARLMAIGHSEAHMLTAPPSLLRALQLLESTSWQLMSPLRLLGRVAGRPPAIRPSDCLKMTDSQLAEVVRSIEQSASWRISGFLRQFKQ